MPTKIEWTDETWNPVTGCSKVSPGCAHCYAETVAARFWPKQYPRVVIDGGITSALRDSVQSTRPREFTDVQCHDDRLDQPLRWRRPRRIFVNSMSDLFHESVPNAFIDRVFAVMALAPQHTFQILTKRAERMRDYFAHERKRKVAVAAAAFNLGKTGPAVASRLVEYQNYDAWPLPNAWLGVSVENQHFADARIPLLLQTSAAVRFISAEPLLGPINLTRIVHVGPGATGTCYLDVVKGEGCSIGGVWPYGRIDWVIVGGESGAGARPFNVAWVRSIVQQCQAAGVAVFVKQLGACITGLKLDGPPFSSPPRREGFLVHWTRHEDNTFGLCDRKGGDPSEWAEDLRVREFPEARS